MGRYYMLLLSFGGTSLMPNYDPLGFLDFHKKESICAALAQLSESVRGESGQLVSSAGLTTVVYIVDLFL